MISVVVRRGAGTHPGRDIVDPLVTALPVALARGRNELDEQSSGLQEVEIEAGHRVGLRKGQVIEVQELLFGTTWYGKIEGITHRAAPGELITTLTVRRPTEFVL